MQAVRGSNVANKVWKNKIRFFFQLFYTDLSNDFWNPMLRVFIEQPLVLTILVIIQTPGLIKLRPIILYSFVPHDLAFLNLPV